MIHTQLLDSVAYGVRRAERLARCGAAKGDPLALGGLLSGFAPEVSPEHLGDLLGGFTPPAPEALGLLAHWVWGEVSPPRGKGPIKEVQWDQLQLSTPPDVTLTEEMLSAPDGPWLACLYALSRLSEEYQEREIQAWSEKAWGESPKDELTLKAWQDIFSPRDVFEGVAAFKGLFGERVRRSFIGLGVSIRLPREVSESHAEQAVDMLDLLPAGMHLDIATRVLEGVRDPIRGLGACVPQGWAPQLEACVARRAHWTKGYGISSPGEGFTADQLESGAGVAACVALIRSFEAGSIKSHAIGLPGWGVVRANRERMRGRLRAFLSRDAEVVSQALVQVPQLHARTAAAMSRHAWAWAWREARRGFAFDIDSMGASPCNPEELVGRLVRPIGDQIHPGVTTFLLLVIAREQWPSLRGWAEGKPSQALSKSFYRCLKALPDDLADPQESGQRVRRYSRLRQHLLEVGIEAYSRPLIAASKAVSDLKPSRSLSKAFEFAIESWWDSDQIPFPSRGLPSFLKGLQGLEADPSTLAPLNEDV